MEHTSKSIAQFQDEIDTWAGSIMPDRSIVGALHKLALEEIPEILQEMRDNNGYVSSGEIADLLILALDIATLAGYDGATAIEEKMAINRKRKWVRSYGTMQHIRSGDENK